MTCLPVNVQFTCAAGGNLIDCAVCPRAPCPYLTANADLTSPFKTHAHIDAALDMEALVGPSGLRPWALIVIGLRIWLRL
eukprot:4571203-Pyramimonas_sp.AAC.1